MGKLIISVGVIISFFLYSLYIRSTGGPQVPLSLPKESQNTSLATSIYQDGDYTGQVVDAFYGDLQVSATIEQGKISNVSFLKYPNDRQTSEMINSQAMPILSQEAISVQKAEVDIVSGATDTSNAFRTSLASALDQAK